MRRFFFCRCRCYAIIATTLMLLCCYAVPRAYVDTPLIVAILRRRRYARHASAMRHATPLV